jgi:tRNA-dihydrouridine synthase B
MAVTNQNTPFLTPLSIGSLQLKNNLIMAPMAGITDLPFRQLAVDGGAGLVCTEMVSAKGLSYNDRRTKKLLSIAENERPVSVQIFGATPGDMGEAARIAEAEGADIIDMNFGCPVRKIMKAGAGAKLLEDEPKIAAIMAAAVKSVKVPVTAKTRIGREPGENMAPRFIRLAEEAGIAMVTLHGRPASAGHTGNPDLPAVREAVAAAVRMPVVGNGGIIDEQTAKEFFEMTACTGIMIGRGAIGDPGLFGRIAHFLTEGQVVKAPSWEERIAVLKRHAEMAAAYYGERRGMILLRKVAPYYLKGLPHASRIRNAINMSESLAQLDTVLQAVWESPYFGEEEA